MSQPNLTLCMIVRDEQEMLPEFISSVEGLWDEFVVADTGSTDHSVKLLEAAGAKVIPFHWVDDFSAARNASLDQATGRWVLYLDADERPTPELKDQIRSLMNDPLAGGATLILRNQWPDGTRRDSPLLRLFRNDPTIRFQYRIHEDASDGVRNFLQANQLQLRHLSGVVLHLGYLRETVTSRDKKTRDLDLLRSSLQAYPRDFYCWFKIMEIARFWDDWELWQETALTASELLAEATDVEKSDLLQRPFSGEFAALIAQALRGTDAERLEWLDASVSFAMPTNAWHLRRGLILENMGLGPESAVAFKLCLAQKESPSTTIRPRLGLCRLALSQGEKPQAAEHLRQACQDGPLDTEALLAAVTILPLMDPIHQPGEFVKDHLQDHPEATLDLAKTLVGVGHLKLATGILSPLAPKNANAALGYLLCCLVENRELDLQVDVEQEEADLLFQSWIQLLWKSRNTELMSSFADGCGSVLEIFPWLPVFLAAETKKLRG